MKRLSTHGAKVQGTNKIITTAAKKSASPSSVIKRANNGVKDLSTLTQANDRTITGKIENSFNDIDIKNVKTVSSLHTDIIIDSMQHELDEIEKSGFSKQRPEILSMFGFEPAFNINNSYNNLSDETAVFDLLNMNLSMRQLRSENIIRLFNELQADENTAKTMNELSLLLKKNDDQFNSELSFLSDFIRLINKAKKSLSIKDNIQQINIETQKLLASSIVGFGLFSLEKLFVDNLKFSLKTYESMSDTKIVMSMINELSNLLMLPFLDQKQEIYDPYIIERDGVIFESTVLVNEYGTGHVNKTFNFQLGDPRKGQIFRKNKKGDLRKIFLMKDFEYFLEQTQDITFSELFTFVNNEIRNSTILAKKNVSDSLKTFYSLTDADISTGDVINNVFGKATIITQALTQNDRTLINCVNLQSTNANGEINTVAAYEKHFVKNNNDVFMFVPGHEYLVDSIKRTRGLTASLYTSYINKFNLSLNKSNEILNDIISFDVKKIYDNFLSKVKPRITFLRSFIDLNADFKLLDGIGEFLFSFANSNMKVKHLLVLWLLVTGYKSNNRFFKLFSQNAEFSSILSNITLSVGDDAELIALSQAVSVLMQVEQNSTTQSSLPLKPPAQQTQQSAQNTTSVQNTSNNQGKAKDILTAIIDLIQAEIFNFYYNGQSVNLRELYDKFRDKVDSSKFTTIMYTHSQVNDALRNPTQSSYILAGILQFFDEIPLQIFNNGLTLLNACGMHHIIWAITELYCKFFKNRFITDFGFDISPADNTLSLLVKFDYETIDAYLSFVSNRTGPYFDTIAYPYTESTQLKINDLSLVKSELIKNVNVISMLKSTLNAVSQIQLSVNSELTKLLDESGANKQIVDQLRSSKEFNKKLSVLSVAQLYLSKNAALEYQTIRQITTNEIISKNSDIKDNQLITPFVDDSLILPHAEGALFSMLKSTSLLAPNANNVRLLSVGLPSGFFESLRQKYKIFYYNSDWLNLTKTQAYIDSLPKETTTIKINVYMQDMLFEDLVFKPQSFIFDVSRFVNMNDMIDVSVDDSRDFDSIVVDSVNSRVFFENGDSITQSYDDFLNDANYSHISLAQKKQLYFNHVKSYLIKLYIKVLTGVDMAEEQFYIDKDISNLRVDDEAKQLFQKMIEARCTAFARKPLTIDQLKQSNVLVNELLKRLDLQNVTSVIPSHLQAVLEDANKLVNVELSSDLTTFMKVFSQSSILLGAGSRRIRMLSPKVFERIFHIAIDPDDFEVDMALTLSTRSGKEFVQSNVAASVLTRVNKQESYSHTSNSNEVVKLDIAARKAIGEISLQQFFVTIEQLPEQQSVQQVAATVAITDDDKQTGQTQTQQTYASSEQQPTYTNGEPIAPIGWPSWG